GGEVGVGLQRRGHLAGARLGGTPADLVALGPAVLQRDVVDAQVDGPVGDVDLDDVAVLHQADGPAFRRFGRDVAYGEAAGAAGEAPVGDQGAGFAEALRFQVARGV